MCGIFGALVVEKDARLNVSVLEELAVINESRGPHAFGFGVTDGDVVKVFKSEGKPSRLKHKIREMMLSGATAFVGHTRWATHGDPSDNRNNHPHNVPTLSKPKVREGVLVHNGVVTNHERLVEQYGINMRSQCDSEVIAKLMSNRRLFENTGSGRLSTLKRAKLTAEALDCPSAFLFMSPKRFAAVRMGRPLWWHKFEGVVYFSSIPLDFDSDYARGAVCDNAVRTYNWSSELQRWKLVGRADISRGTRGKQGARRSVSELSRDWRTASSPDLLARVDNACNEFRQRQSADPQMTRSKVDKLLRGSYVPSKGVPHWKQVAEELKNAPPIDDRPEKSGGKRITYLTGTDVHAPSCHCGRCLKIKTEGR
jgi:predicted glutamine amidotransferase